MVRYSFLVGLFHPRLHAGLSRRLRSLTVTALYRILVRLHVYVAHPKFIQNNVDSARPVAEEWKGTKCPLLAEPLLP